jgi:hypothetical protein
VRDVETTSTDRQGIVERYNTSACTGAADGGYALLIRPNGNVRFKTLKNGCEFDTLDAVATVRDGNWHHIAGVFDGSQMRVYADGQLKASKASAFAPGTGSSHLLIGRSQDGSGFFNGLIDEVRVTARAVYTTNFTSQHKLTGVVDTKGLWRFDRQNARDCADIHNGATMGGATFSSVVP